MVKEEPKTEDGVPVKKEPAILSESSLAALGGELGENCLRLAMYLNVPTTTLIHIQLRGQSKNLSTEEINGNMLLQWKEQRAMAKDKEKTSELDRALRENGNTEIADVVSEKHRENTELSADMFPK